MKTTIALLATLSFTASAQTPVFEAAETRVSKTAPSDSYSVFEGGCVEFRGASMLEFIAAAYKLDREFILGGPSWLDTDRFDLTARVPRDTPDETVRLMMQSLLAERFGLEVHRQEKPMPVFLLTVSKRGLKLKKSSGEGGLDCNPDNSKQPNTSYVCRHGSATDIGQFLRLAAGGYVNHQVIDETGLKDTYDFSLTWSPRGRLRVVDADANTISLFDALEKQLGLVVEPETRAMPVIVVDRVNREPSGGATTKALPPPPKEFEVATLHPSKPGAAQREARLLPSGAIDWPGVTLKQMIQQAYGIDPQDDDLISGPKWIASEHFDFIAKSAPGVPFDALEVMLQNFLKDRFDLQVHIEKLPVNVYALTAPKHHKLKDAAPDQRSQCTPGTGDGFRTFTCQNMTMAQFVEKVRPTARGYLDHPVVDLTEITGAFDFTLRWTGKQALNANAAPGVGTASDPNGGVSLWEAVDKQLGLKLAPQKYPLPVLVIDHAEQTPKEN